MIAIIDAEFNRNANHSNEKTDSSLIEVALIIKESIVSDDVVATYHSYVKPERNNGILYERIANMTGIRQEDIDSARSFDEVYDELLTLKNKYNIKKIYCWGEYDRYAFSWNMRNSSKKCTKEKDKSFYHLFKDKEKDVLEYLKLPAKQTALKKLAYICDYSETDKHNAVSDANTLAYVLKTVYNNSYNRRKRYEYYCYLHQIRLTKELKNTIEEIRKMKFNEEELISLAKAGEQLPPFEGKF